MWPTLRSLRFVLALALTALVLGACSGSGDGGREPGGVASAEASPRTPRTEPPASDPDEVRPYIDDLLERYDQVVNQIGADPGVAGDSDDPLVEEYVSLFEPDSQFAESALAAWASDSEVDRTVQPYSDGYPALAIYLDGDLEVVDGDEVGFPLCIERRQLVYEGDVLRQETPYFQEPGAGVAVRVDGAWRLRRMDRSADMAGCGSGVP